MTEIKIRVWDKQDKQYWTDEMIKQNAGWLLYPDNDNIDEVIIEQSTGLKDKNGNLIYEGDVVFYGEDISLPDEFVLIGEVKWSQEHGGWNVYGKEDICTLCDYVDEWEIIGNINENPELLEQ